MIAAQGVALAVVQDPVMTVVLVVVGIPLFTK
jgi:hypothetical protein